MPKRLTFLKEITCDAIRSRGRVQAELCGRAGEPPQPLCTGRDGDQCQGSPLSRPSVTDRKGAPPVLLLPLLALGCGQGLGHQDRAPRRPSTFPCCWEWTMAVGTHQQSGRGWAGRPGWPRFLQRPRGTRAERQSDTKEERERDKDRETHTRMHRT